MVRFVYSLCPPRRSCCGECITAGTSNAVGLPFVRTPDLTIPLPLHGTVGSALSLSIHEALPVPEIKTALAFITLTTRIAAAVTLLAPLRPAFHRAADISLALTIPITFLIA